jgi:hypothetical protein
MEISGFSLSGLPYSSAFFEPVDQFDFIRLIFEYLARFVRRDNLLLEPKLARDDLPHALFDLFQIFRR